MSNEQDDQSSEFKWALIATGVWCVALCVTCVANWADIVDAKPNELGDFLAGFFAPLAFFWFIVTVLLQRRELQLSRQEMRLTRIELSRQSAAMESTLAIDRENKVRRELEIAVGDVPRRMRPLIQWLRKFKPLRNGDTGERLSDDAKDAFDWIPKAAPLSDAQFLARFSSCLAKWNREYRQTNGKLTQTLDDNQLHDGELQWELFRRWWAAHHAAAMKIDDTTLAEAAAVHRLDLLQSVMTQVFEGEWVLVDASV